MKEIISQRIKRNDKLLKYLNFSIRTFIMTSHYTLATNIVKFKMNVQRNSVHCKFAICLDDEHQYLIVLKFKDEILFEQIVKPSNIHNILEDQFGIFVK